MNGTDIICQDPETTRFKQRPTAEPSSRARLDPPANITGRAEHETNQDVSVSLGHLVYSSLQQNDEGNDWAVIELEPDILRHFEERDDDKLATILGPVLNPRSVVVMTASGAVRGCISATPSFWRLPGRPKYAETYLVHCERPLGKSLTIIVAAQAGD
jgi:hypothetical protein